MDISVVLTTYNGESFLKEQLDSILIQTLPPKEIIVVDDCSTDSTYEILKSYANIYSIVKVFRNEINLGAHQNFRKAFSLSTCPLIAPSDQDDIWRADKLELMKRILIERNVNLVYSQENIMWENGEMELDVHEMPDMKDFIWGNCLKGHTFLFRRELLDVFDVVKSLSFDYALAIRACITEKYASTNETLSIWRRHNGVMTTAVSCNSELVIQKISKWKKVKYAFCNLNKERSKPMETSFRDRSKIFSNLNVLDSKMNTTLSKICDNIAKQSRISLIKASILNLVVQHYEGGLTNRIGHAMWAIRQPWIYWYDMHKLHALE